jgi:hypothetical protein
MKTKYSIWAEGWAANGDGYNLAKLVGRVEAETFLEACQEWGKSQPNYFRITDGKPYYWGCQLFDNETDARKLEERFSFIGPV